MAPEEELSPERAARLLRAFQGELETVILPVKLSEVVVVPIDPVMLASHLAMVCQILADHLEAE